MLGAHFCSRKQAFRFDALVFSSLLVRLRFFSPTGRVKCAGKSSAQTPQTHNPPRSQERIGHSLGKFRLTVLRAPHLRSASPKRSLGLSSCLGYQFIYNILILPFFNFVGTSCAEFCFGRVIHSTCRLIFHHSILRNKKARPHRRASLELAT